MVYQYRKKGTKDWRECNAETYNSMIHKPPFKNNFEFRTIEAPAMSVEELVEKQAEELKETDDAKPPKKRKN